MRNSRVLNLKPFITACELWGEAVQATAGAMTTTMEDEVTVETESLGMLFNELSEESKLKAYIMVVRQFNKDAASQTEFPEKVDLDLFFGELNGAMSNTITFEKDLEILEVVAVILLSVIETNELKLAIVKYIAYCDKNEPEFLDMSYNEGFESFKRSFEAQAETLSVSLSEQ